MTKTTNDVKDLIDKADKNMYKAKKKALESLQERD
jgi:GGDEF domain-containing protein